MRQTAALLPPLTQSPAAGLCRLLSAPAAQRSFPTLSLPIFPCVSGPILRLLPGCTCPFLPLEQWPSPSEDGVGAMHRPDNSHFCRIGISELQSFTNVQTHKVASHTGSSHPRVLRRRAAVAFTSAHITVRYLAVQRICSPPKSGQLTVRGLTPLKIGSLVGCSPRLPDAGQLGTAAGQTRDLPVPVQGACAHARFYDRAGSGERLR